MEFGIRVNNLTDISILLPLFSRLGISFTEKTKNEPTNNTLPITYAEEPNFMALAGIWENQDITIEQLRQDAWGGRL
jgi:hypothetical protein